MQWSTLTIWIVLTFSVLCASAAVTFVVLAWFHTRKTAQASNVAQTQAAGVWNFTPSTVNLDDQVNKQVSASFAGLTHDLAVDANGKLSTGTGSGSLFGLIPGLTSAKSGKTHTTYALVTDINKQLHALNEDGVFRTLSEGTPMPTALRDDNGALMALTADCTQLNKIVQVLDDGTVVLSDLVPFNMVHVGSSGTATRAVSSTILQPEFYITATTTASDGDCSGSSTTLYMATLNNHWSPTAMYEKRFNPTSDSYQWKDVLGSTAPGVSAAISEGENSCLTLAMFFTTDKSLASKFTMTRYERTSCSGKRENVYSLTTEVAPVIMTENDDNDYTYQFMLSVFGINTIFKPLTDDPNLLVPTTHAAYIDQTRPPLVGFVLLNVLPNDPSKPEHKLQNHTPNYSCMQEFLYSGNMIYWSDPFNNLWKNRSFYVDINSKIHPMDESSFATVETENFALALNSTQSPVQFIELTSMNVSS